MRLSTPLKKRKRTPIQRRMVQLAAFIKSEMRKDNGFGIAIMASAGSWKIIRRALLKASKP